jgi:ssDNA-binding Zn-finger/Zn-ribbon topoisomerase 1
MWARVVGEATTMASTCPECGSAMEFADHEVRLKTGVCPSCSKEFAMVEGSTVSARLGSPPARGPTSTAEEDDEEEEVEVVEGGPECEECGTPLAIGPGPNGSLKVACPECETSTIFVPQSEERPKERSRERGPRFESEGPRSRPCRKCGAPLRFSTGEDGLLVGECEACGNRFTLPPRPDRGGGNRGFRGGPPYGRREFRSGGGGPRRFSDRREGRGGRPFRSRDRGRSDDDESSDSNRRSRRRRAREG